MTVNDDEIVLSDLTVQMGPAAGGTAVTAIGAGITASVIGTMDGIGIASPSVISSSQLGFSTPSKGAASSNFSNLLLLKGVNTEQLGPQYISPAVLFLASDLAADITGQVVGVQGPKIFVYKMEQSEGVEKDASKGLWTPQEIKEGWSKISSL